MDQEPLQIEKEPNKSLSALPFILIGIIVTIVICIFMFLPIPAKTLCSLGFSWHCTDTTNSETLYEAVTTQLFVPKVSPKNQIMISTPTPTRSSETNMANWKTFNEFGVQFNYPNTWYEGSRAGEGGPEGSYATIEFSNYPYKDAGKYLSNFSTKPDYITLTFNTSHSPANNNKSALDLLNIDKKNNPNWNYSEPQTRIIQGIQFLYYSSFNKTSPNYSMNVLTKKDDGRYQLDVTVSSQDMLEKNKELFDQILSTFKFTQ